jgi:hypothetical protein
MVMTVFVFVPQVYPGIIAVLHGLKIAKFILWATFGGGESC